MRFYKRHKTDVVFWVDNPEIIGEHLFSFDKINIYNLFSDYPNCLSQREKEIFDKENPYWADFFKDRTYYNDLKNKTIFDFCKDKRMISDIIIVSKDAYLRELASCPLLNAHTLIEYAEIVGNRDLLNAVKAQYKQELDVENNEYSQSVKKKISKF